MKFTNNAAKAAGILYLLLALSIYLPPPVSCQELILMRSAKTLSQNQIMIWESLFFAPLTKKYNFEREKFLDLKGDNYSFTAYSMLGYGLTDHVELLIQVPVPVRIATDEGVTNSSAGIGDASLQGRLMLHGGEGPFPALNLGFMLRFPTGNNREKPPLGDGTIDLGFSLVMTKRFGFFVLHLKSGYIFNGENGDATDIGDKFLYMVKGDFIVASGDYTALKELALMLGVCGNWKLKDMDTNGDYLDNTQQYRPFNIAFMIRWTPVKGLFIRPRVIVPIEPLSRGGKLYAAQYVMDFKYSF